MNNILKLFQDEPRPPFSVSLEMNNIIKKNFRYTNNI